jgi:hypothetical protein
MQFDVAALKHRANRHAALLATGVTLVETGARCVAAHQLHAIRAAAVWADRTVRPHEAFQLRVGCGFVLEVRGAENAGHQLAPSMKLAYSVTMGSETTMSPRIESAGL